MGIQIEKITFQNLLSFSQQEIDNLSNLNVLIGPNNSGKSNVFRILRNIHSSFKAIPNFFFQNFLAEKAQISLLISVSEEIKKIFFNQWLKDEANLFYDRGKSNWQLLLLADQKSPVLGYNAYSIFSKLCVSFGFNSNSILLQEIFFIDASNKPLYIQNIGNGINFGSPRLSGGFDFDFKLKYQHIRKITFQDILENNALVADTPRNFAFFIINEVFPT